MTTSDTANILLQIASGVRVQPAIDFPPDILDRLGGARDDYVLSQDRSRFAAQRISADAARLILKFREPIRILDAIIAYASEANQAPAELLAEAFPLIQRLRAQRVLLAPTEIRPAAVEPRFEVGDSVVTQIGVVTIEAVISADTETEIFRVVLPDGQRAALKYVPDSAPEFVRRSVANEASTLRALTEQGFVYAPHLLAIGRSAEPPAELLLTQWIDGASAYKLARDPDLAPVQRARLASRLINAYADLHALGWLHGDVHPGNVIGAGDTITLIDFGGALRIDETSPPIRAGLLTEYEPEAARALMAGLPLPTATALGEQYCVAAIVLRLLTGSPTHRLPLEADLAIAIIADQPARRLAELGLVWPELETVIARALSLDPAARFADTRTFADAFEAGLKSDQPPSTVKLSTPKAYDPLGALAALSAPDSPLGQVGIKRGPRATIYHGGAGLSFACLAAAETTGRADLLTRADHWAEAAVAALTDPDAFDARDIGVRAGDLSPASFFHGPAGVYAVHSRVRLAHNDLAGAMVSAAAAICAFGPSGPIPSEPKLGLDLLNGVSGQLLGFAFLADGFARLGLLMPDMKEKLEAAAATRAVALADALSEWFNRPMDELPSEGRYLGLAHGSGGALLALLRTVSILPKALTGIDLLSLIELQAAHAFPDGSGFPVERSGSKSWVGWCHGSAGHLMLWTAAAQYTKRASEVDRASQIARDLMKRGREGGATLCCGAAGLIFALDGFEQFVGSRGSWRAELANTLASVPDLLLPHSLWRGYPGIQLASLVIDDPGGLGMPFLT
jgi:eukaryotic-like serine/threonine-protein kinase